MLCENLFWKPSRDIEYDLMAESTEIPLVKTTGLEEMIKDNVMTENFYKDTEERTDRSEAKSQNIQSQEDPAWSYTGSVWPMPKRQIFKELADT